MPKFKKSAGYKMKGSPFQRNFGIGSPLKQNVPMAPGAAAGAEAAKASKGKTTKSIEHTMPVPYFKDPKEKKIDVDWESLKKFMKK